MKQPTSMQVRSLMTRREAIGAGLASVAVLLVGCDSNPTGGTQVDGNPRLTVRHTSPTGGIEPGLHDLGSELGRTALLYVPGTYNPATPAPLALMLHGASGTATRGLIPFQDVADELGMILLSPESYSTTWDMVRGVFGVDVTFINAALAMVFDQCNIDPARIAIAGFSDGASYALSLGTANGDLFRYIAAFSPGFLVRKSPQGSPHIFVSHGTQDQVLPIDQTSRRIVPRLRLAGYEVDYREFDGPHGIELDLAAAAAEQIASGASVFEVPGIR